MCSAVWLNKLYQIHTGTKYQEISSVKTHCLCWYSHDGLYSPSQYSSKSCKMCLQVSARSLWWQLIKTRYHLHPDSNWSNDGFLQNLPFRFLGEDLIELKIQAIIDLSILNLLFIIWVGCIHGEAQGQFWAPKLNVNHSLLETYCIPDTEIEIWQHNIASCINDSVK